MYSYIDTYTCAHLLEQLADHCHRHQVFCALHKREKRKPGLGLSLSPPLSICLYIYIYYIYIERERELGFGGLVVEHEAIANRHGHPVLDALEEKREKGGWK